MWGGSAAPTKAIRWRGRVGRRPAQVVPRRSPDDDRSPAGGVVDEQARSAGGPAGQHHSVAVQVELVAGDPPDPVQQFVASQARVTDELIEVLHEERFVEHG